MIAIRLCYTSRKHLPKTRLWGLFRPFFVHGRKYCVLFWVLTYIQAHQLITLHKTGTILCVLSTETPWPTANPETCGSGRKWRRQLFRGPWGTKHLLLYATHRKLNFIDIQSEFFHAFRTLFLQPTDLAPPLHLDPFFLIWSCNKPDPFPMRAIPFFLLMFPMDKCLPMHFGPCWNACPGSGVQQSWSVLRSSSWVLIWLFHLFSESVHFGSWARPDFMTCTSAVSCDSSTISPCSLEQSLWDSRCTDLQVERKFAVTQA